MKLRKSKESFEVDEDPQGPTQYQLSTHGVVIEPEWSAVIAIIKNSGKRKNPRKADAISTISGSESFGRLMLTAGFDIHPRNTDILNINIY